MGGGSQIEIDVGDDEDEAGYNDDDNGSATLLDCEAVRTLVRKMTSTNHTAGLVDLLRRNDKYTECLQAMIRQLDPSAQQVAAADLAAWGREPTLAISVDILTEVIRGAPSVEDRADCQVRLNNLGTGLVVIKLIGRSASIPRDLLFAALGLAMVLLEGGNRQVQEEVVAYLLQSKLDEAFFVGVTSLFRLSTATLNENQRRAREGGGNDDDDGKAGSVSGAPGEGKMRSMSSMSRNFGSVMQQRSGASVAQRDSTARLLELSSAEGKGAEEVVSGVTTTSAGGSVDLALMVRLVEVLRLLCEDHYTPIQDYFRRQPDNLRSYNLVGEVAIYLGSLQWVIDKKENKPAYNIDAAVAPLCTTLLRCLSEFAQGNAENQVVGGGSVVVAVGGQRWGRAPCALALAGGTCLG